MISGIDFAVLISAGLSFCFFLIAHVIALRILKKFPAPLAILGSIFGGMILDIFIFSFFYKNHAHQNLPMMSVSFAACLSVLIYLYLVLHYIAFVFGMGEASIRVRLLFEVAEGSSGGVTTAQILSRYNAVKILSTRLGRLISAGHFKSDGTYYEIKSKILLLQLFLINFFRWLLGIKEKLSS